MILTEHPYAWIDGCWWNEMEWNRTKFRCLVLYKRNEIEWSVTEPILSGTTHSSHFSFPLVWCVSNKMEHINNPITILYFPLYSFNDFSSFIKIKIKSVLLIPFFLISSPSFSFLRVCSSRVGILSFN